MRLFKRIALLFGLAFAIPIVYATWPTTPVNTGLFDSNLDSAQDWRDQSFQGWTRFNQLIAHVSTFMQGVLTSADAAAARSTLGAVASSGGTLSGATLTGGTANAGNTISGGTLSGATLTGGTTNTGNTISDGNLSGATISGLVINNNSDGIYVRDTSALNRKSLFIRSDNIYQLGETGFSLDIKPTIVSPVLSGTLAGVDTLDGTASLAKFKNPSTGTSAVSLFSIGNNVSDFRLGLKVYGSNHSTKPNRVEIINEDGTAPLCLGASGTASLCIDTSGTVSSTKSCATGYTRVTPNYCVSNGTVTGTTLLTRDSCTLISALVGTGAKAILFEIDLDIKANNSAGIERSTHVGGWDDDESCVATNEKVRIRGSVLEFTAQTDGLTIANHFGQMLLVSATPYLKMIDDSGDGGTASYRILGYYD